jgi:16S rRNA (cytosine1407-C5)-methyltransferase
MKQDFLNYIKNEFNFLDEEMTQFESACSMPLKKSIRVNTNKISIEDFKKIAIKNNWKLIETSL